MMYGSVLSAIQRPQNSVVHDGCLGEVTFEPSFRTILFGSAINKGIATPILVKARKPIWWWEKSGDRGLGLQHVYKRSWGGDVRRYHCQLRVVSMERRLSIWEMVASSGDNDFLTLVCLNISPIVMKNLSDKFEKRYWNILYYANSDRARQMLQPHCPNWKRSRKCQWIFPFLVQWDKLT